MIFRKTLMRSPSYDDTPPMRRLCAALACLALAAGAVAAAAPASAANGPPPCSTQPSAWLLNTTLMIGMSCSIAVIRPFIVIANPPSPDIEITCLAGCDA